MGIAMSSNVLIQAEPYVGPRPFETGDRHLFFGREREAHEISSLVLANKFFMLYAASGAGKTSLVNAGVRPLVSTELEVLPTARFQATYPGMEANVSNVYTYAVLAGWAQPDMLSQLTRTTLTEYLESRPRRALPGDLPRPRLLIFDQFEELFTTHPERWQDRRIFLDQLAEASSSHADLRILVVIREDFLSHLLDYAETFYGGLKDRYFLEPLRKPEAELAIESPAMRSGRSFEPDAVDDLVQRLMASRVEVGDSRIVHIEGEFVEPVLLQVACRALWIALPRAVSRISLTHVRELADVDTALARFYSDAVREAARIGTATERQIREWVQQNLITPEGTRGTVHVGATTTAGLPNDAVSSLEGKFLRAEFRAGARWLEITHDSLLAPIEQSNREFFSSRRESTLSDVVDVLAYVVRGQWEIEARVRRLNDPYPLPIGWTAADPALAASWEGIERLASSGAGWRISRSSRFWATGPDHLAGQDNDLVHVLNRVPTRRLVVLGEPGSGKTMLMVRLLLDLLNDRVPGGVVPVLVSVAGWDPAQESMNSWLSSHLIMVYPKLAARAEQAPRTRTVIQAMLEARLILPILDGLDEIPTTLRSLAIQRINEALRPDEPLVVTCRTQQYLDAVQSPSSDPILLQAAAAIELRPLDARAVADYLRDSAPTPTAATRWDPVLGVLGTEAPVAQALTRPLTIALARAIYNPLPGERIEELPDPASLCSPLFPDRAAVEIFLFDAFIPAVYRVDADARWSAADANRWLTFLAVYLEHTIASPDLAWWRLAKAIPDRALGLTVGVVLGLIFGAVGGLVLGLQWLGLAMAAGIVAGLAIGFGLVGDRRPARGVMWRPFRTVRVGVPIGIAALVSGVVIGRLETGLTAALLLFALLPGFAAGLQGRGVGRLELASSPRTALRRDRSAAFTIGIMTALAIGSPVGLATGIARGLTVGITLGIVSGLAVGLAAISYESTWLRWQLARCWLWASRRLPWRLMTFLEDAEKRGTLRQVGSVYQFRHIQLQHSLASRASLRDATRRLS